MRNIRSTVLGIFDDRFLIHLFDLVEETRDLEDDDTFNYSVIKLIVSAWRTMLSNLDLFLAVGRAQRAVHGGDYAGRGSLLFRGLCSPCEHRVFANRVSEPGAQAPDPPDELVQDLQREPYFHAEPRKQ
jgi:hypothetical protein